MQTRAERRRAERDGRRVRRHAPAPRQTDPGKRRRTPRMGPVTTMAMMGAMQSYMEMGRTVARDW